MKKYIGRLRQVGVLIILLLVGFIVSFGLVPAHAQTAVPVILVASLGTDQVLAYDQVSGAPLGQFGDAGPGAPAFLNDPAGMTTNGTTLLVSSRATGEVKLFDQAGTYLGNFATGLDSPNGILVTTWFGQPRVLIAEQTGNSILVYDFLGNPAGFFIVPGQPTDMWGIGNTLYVTAGNQVLLYNATNGALAGQFTGGTGLLDILVDATNRLFVTSQGTNTVNVFTLTGGFLGFTLDTATCGTNGVNSLAIGADGFIYVTGELGNQVQRFNAVTGACAGNAILPGAGGLQNPTDIVFTSVIIDPDPDPIPGDAPVARFGRQPREGVAPLTVTITERSEGDITAWAWDFDGDGTTDSTTQNPPPFTYDDSGEYTVTLTVTGSEGTDSRSRPVSVLAEEPEEEDDTVEVVDELPPPPDNGEIQPDPPPDEGDDDRERDDQDDDDQERDRRDDDNDDDDCDERGGGIGPGDRGRELLCNIVGDIPEFVEYIDEFASSGDATDGFASVMAQLQIPATQSTARGLARTYIRALDWTTAEGQNAIGSAEVLNFPILYAVDLFAFDVDSGNPVIDFVGEYTLCMRGVGSIFELDASGQPRTPQWSTAGWLRSGWTCTYVDGAATYVLVDVIEGPLVGRRGAVVTTTQGATGDATSSASITPLTGCRVTTTDMLNFRSEPSIEGDVKRMVPYDITLEAINRTEGWYNVIYGDDNGWVSAAYLQMAGTCE